MSHEQAQINWSRMSLEELQQYWNAHVELDLERNGVGLESRPTYREITDAGYSGIAYALREHHGLTLTEFLATVGYDDCESSDGYSWGIDDDPTIDALEAFLRRVERKWAQSTADSKRYRLATYVRLYDTVHGTAAIVDRVMDGENQYDELPRVEAVLDELDDDLESDASKRRYLSDIRQFYDHLENRHGAKFNPGANVDHAEIWDTEGETDNPALSSEQIGALYDAAETPDEQLLILALCGWGLRRSEVASLHSSQLVLEGDDPHITFGEERKNGPGTVALIYGVSVLLDRIETLEDRDELTGYLFPSKRSSSGHITGETVQARFKRLADRAGVRVYGDEPTSKMGRRFWYTTYNAAIDELLNNLGTIAAEQGSADPSVVLKNYLSESERRKYRREYMRDRLVEAFGQ